MCIKGGRGQGQFALLNPEFRISPIKRLTFEQLTHMIFKVIKLRSRKALFKANRDLLPVTCH